MFGVDHGRRYDRDMKIKKSVYLDTTIPSYYYDSRPATVFLTQATRHWFRAEAPRYRVVVSEATLVEASSGDYAAKSRVLAFIQKWPALEYAPILTEIAAAYVENFLMPAEYGGDALHLAYASYHRIDFLMTWNCEHLANANKRQHIRIINTRLGLSVPEIVTPIELITETGETS